MIQKNNSGFLLIEASIFLILFGVISVLAYSTYSVSKKSYEVALTKKNQEIISEVLGAYLAWHSHLPNAASAESHGMSVEGLTYGEVPYKTLGISEANIRDGRGKPIKYLVSKAFTLTQKIKTNEGIGYDPDSFCDITESEIFITDSYNENISNEPICFVLITSRDYDRRDFNISKLQDNSLIKWVSKNELIRRYAKDVC